MSSERLQELLGRALDYIYEVVRDEEEVYRVYTETIGLTDKELIELGFNLN